MKPLIDREVTLHVGDAGVQRNPSSIVLNEEGYGLVVWEHNKGPNTFFRLRVRKIYPSGELMDIDKEIPTGSYDAFDCAIYPYANNGFTCAFMSFRPNKTLLLAHYKQDFTLANDTPPIVVNDKSLLPLNSAIANSKKTTGVAFIASGPSTSDYGVYFRGYKFDFTPWADKASKISTDEEDNQISRKSIAIATTDFDTFWIGYSIETENPDYDTVSKLFIKKVNQAGQILYSVPVTTTAPYVAIGPVNISISATGHIAVAWVEGNQLQLRAYDKFFSKPPLQQQLPGNVHHYYEDPYNYYKFGLQCDNANQLFTVSYSGKLQPSQAEDEVYFYATDFSGDQKYFQTVSTLKQPDKMGVTHTPLKSTGDTAQYFTSWGTRKIDNSQPSFYSLDVFGRNTLFKLKDSKPLANSTLTQKIKNKMMPRAKL